MPVISLEKCQYYWDDLTNNMICAGSVSPEKDACSGDSGGPLTARQDGDIRLAGLVSYGMSCDSPYRHSIAVYTRVSNFSGWIKSYTDKKSSISSGGGSFVWTLFPLLGLLLLRKKYYLTKGI
ncbi:MAG: hypothetical protein DSZ29_04005 [Aquificaceae bacterium]|nr:MAG: hypothetical protein DSZ29_04005 [Aquificaceae bacterium]